MDDINGSRTESAESHPRDSDSLSDAVDGGITPVPQHESSQPSHSDGDRPKRRIAIGTQRADSAQTETAPRYTYITSKTSAAGSTDTSSEPSDPSSSKAEDEKNSRPKKTKEHRRGRPERGGKASAFIDSAPHQKRVNIPNLRQDLDEDLEKDFEAALAGLEVESLLEQTSLVDQPIQPGAKVEGTVISIGPETAFIDLGNQRQGALQLAGLFEESGELPEVGQTVEVSVGGHNEEDGLYEVAPANRAVAVEDWSQLEVGMIVSARCTGVNKGGVECDVAGIRGFMPTSLISPWRIESPEEMIGQTLESLVTEVVPHARRLVLSRRAVIEKQAADAKSKMLETLEPGDKVEGIVRSIRDFGAFVDIGNGVEGLVHVSQLAWERVNDPKELLEIGQHVHAMIKKVDRDTGKIGLSIRDLVESPWTRADAKYSVGSTVRGTVSRIADFGAFVKLEPGVEGLIHVSELATRRIRSVSDVVQEGEQIECRVLSVDPAEQRLSLSLKALNKADTAHEQDSSSDEEDIPAPPAKARSKSNVALKGGISGQSDGARFGLKW
ncbi:MAG: S1 RNA-binding domain-containing protein [Pirellulales bacterium]